MSCHPVTTLRTLALAALLGALLAGCSDIYFDRRDTIALGAGDAIAANQRDADGRSVAARQRQPQHRLQRREDADRASSAIAPTA